MGDPNISESADSRKVGVTNDFEDQNYPIFFFQFLTDKGNKINRNSVSNSHNIYPHKNTTHWSHQLSAWYFRRVCHPRCNASLWTGQGSHPVPCRGSCSLEDSRRERERKKVHVKERGGEEMRKRNLYFARPCMRHSFPCSPTFSGPYWPEKFAKVCKLPILALAGGPTVCRKGTLCLPG